MMSWIKKLLCFKKLHKVDYLLQIVEKTDKNNPQSCDEFINLIPQFHKSEKAMNLINIYSPLTHCYAQRMIDKYAGHLPWEVEERVISLERTYLIHHLTKLGVIWSPNARELMARIRPGTYKRCCV